MWSRMIRALASVAVLHAGSAVAQGPHATIWERQAAGWRVIHDHWS